MMEVELCKQSKTKYNKYGLRLALIIVVVSAVLLSIIATHL